MAEGDTPEGHSSQEISPLKEVPQNTSIVRIPAVGKIRGREVKFYMHDSPMRAMFQFFNSPERNIADLSVEGRILLTEAQRRQMDKNPKFAFLSHSRIRLQEIEGEYFGYMVFPKYDINGALINETQAVDYSSQTADPNTLSAEVGYNVGFVPLEQMHKSAMSKIETAADYMVRGCNEFRIGSNSLSQVELDNLAQDLGRYIFDDEITRAKLSAYKDEYKTNKPSQEGFNFIPLNVSYIPK